MFNGIDSILFSSIDSMFVNDIDSTLINGIDSTLIACIDSTLLGNVYSMSCNYNRYNWHFRWKKWHCIDVSGKPLFNVLSMHMCPLGNFIKHKFYAVISTFCTNFVHFWPKLAVWKISNIFWTTYRKKTFDYSKDISLYVDCESIHEK